MTELKLNKLISISARKGQAYLTHEFIPLNISSGEFFYILRACENEGLSQDKLSKLVGIKKSTTTKVLAQLEKEGYVRRKQDECDKRVYKVYPTEKAKEVYPKIIKILDQWNDILVQGLTAEEVETLTRLMQKVELNALEYEK